MRESIAEKFTVNSGLDSRVSQFAVNLEITLRASADGDDS